jgi:hypothetical protein
MATRRTQGSLSPPSGSSDIPQTRVRPLESPSSVSSAFGPAPVWAGGSPAGSRADSAHGVDQLPPEPLPAPAPHPALSGRTMRPPPLTMAVQPGSALGWESEPDPLAVSDPEPLAPRGRDPDPVQEAGVADGAGEDPPCVEVVAVPGNSAHASRVMHVSSLRAPVAREIPTAWMVVTPMELLGDQAPQTAPAPISETVRTPVAEPAPEPTASPEVEQPEAPPHEEVILVTPNPFGPSRARSPHVDLGMPSSLLADLLGSEAPVGE